MWLFILNEHLFSLPAVRRRNSSEVRFLFDCMKLGKTKDWQTEALDQVNKETSWLLFVNTSVRDSVETLHDVFRKILHTFNVIIQHFGKQASLPPEDTGQRKTDTQFKKRLKIRGKTALKPDWKKNVHLQKLKGDFLESFWTGFL